MYVDFHAHILPGTDHGCDDLRMAISQLRYAEAAGVDTIVATPHFYLDEDNIESFLARRDAAMRLLMSHYDGDIRIIPGAEVTLHVGIENLEGLEKLCIGNTNYILIEFPEEPWPYWIFDAATEIARTRRLRPICAHIDRYSDIGRAKILQLHMDVQLNANAFYDSFRKRREYLDMIADDEIHVLGSDVHGDGKVSYRDFTRATKKIGGYMSYMTENARRILSHEKKD